MDIITRDQWGATPSKQGPKLKKWDGWVLHWRDSAKVGDLGGEGLMRQAERYHEQNKGWADIAYHIGIDREGSIFQGRDIGRQGAATYGQNRTTMAIVFLFGTGELTAPAIEAARWIIHTYGPAEGFPALLAGPHSQFRATDCPGDEIRAAITKGIFDQPVTPPPPGVPAERSTHPAAATKGFLINDCLAELDAITLAVRGTQLSEEELTEWTADLVGKVYSEGATDLSGVTRWSHWFLTEENKKG